MTTTTAAPAAVHARRHAEAPPPTGAPAPALIDIDVDVDRDVDLDRPSMARVEDYLLGGAYNLAADRALARRLLATVPDAAQMARQHRAFLGRAVRWCLAAGVRQVLDLGSAMPTVGNARQVARHAAKDVRIVLADRDPLTVALAAMLLAGDDRAVLLHADLCRPDDILDHPALRAVLDLDQPVAVLLVGVLQAVSGTDAPHAIVAQLRDRIAPGSHLIVSHPCAEGGRPDVAAVFAEMGRQAGTPLTLRTQTDIERLFTGLDLVDPGLVWVPRWRPESPDATTDRAWHSSILAGVGRKP
jgi:S-adenosyl methyltransferase